MNVATLSTGIVETGLSPPDGLVHGTVLTKKPMTPAQRRVLVFIHRYAQEKGYAPGLRDIGAALGMKSTNAPSEALRKLEDRGLVVVSRMISRGIRITVEGYAALGIQADVNAPPRSVASTERLELIASRREAARLRSLLYRVSRATMGEFPAVLSDIKRELGE